MAQLSITLGPVLTGENLAYGNHMRSALYTRHAAVPFVDSHAVLSWLEQHHHNTRVRFKTGDRDVQLILKDDDTGVEKTLLTVNVR